MFSGEHKLCSAHKSFDIRGERGADIDRGLLGQRFVRSIVRNLFFGLLIMRKCLEANTLALIAIGYVFQSE